MLSDVKLRKMLGKPIPERIEISDANGLSIRVTPMGSIAFQYRYRFGGKPRRMTIGSYDDVSLKEAREITQEAKRVLLSGRDPITVRLMKLDSQVGSATVSQCLEHWTSSAQAQRLVKLEYWKRAFQRHIIPYVGSMTVDDMEISHWQPVFKRMRENGAPTFAGIMLSKLKQAFSYGVRTEFIEKNPVDNLRIQDVGTPVKSRKRHFNDSEIGLFWLTLERSTITPQNKLFIKLMLLTACRGVELRKATKSEFDLENATWLVPAENSKTREQFVRGLSKEAVRILRMAFYLYPKYKQVFPPAAIQKDRPMSAGVLLNMARVLSDDMGGEPWAMHDLRRTAKTKMSELGVLPHISEKVLGHKLGGVLAVYDQHAYLKEQQDALDLLAAHISSCVDSVKP